ncbi:glycine cleavage system protein GcvH [Aquisphaera insulae]|uniref:glycine cleavage system protein GcvH n=1 Tax=Aquisphaera insulae TaxID=2712864 RepID=UPI0013EC3182|nr:glycine cleavage system protein GcvH [Aquisphaera insulae]
MDPTTLLYLPSHEWVHLDGKIATIGISKFAVDQLTDLLMIDLPEVGKTLKAGKGFGEIESVKSVSELYAPFSGKVTEVNQAVADDLTVLSEDPFGKGWLIKMEIDDPSATSDLLDHAAYEKKVAEEEH